MKKINLSVVGERFFQLLIEHLRIIILIYWAIIFWIFYSYWNNPFEIEHPSVIDNLLSIALLSFIFAGVSFMVSILIALLMVRNSKSFWYGIFPTFTKEDYEYMNPTKDQSI